MSFPMQVAASMTGLPKKAPAAPKPTRRGRKPSGKPGAAHLASLQQAHGAGNFAQAKTHALNYAKAVHQSMTATEPDQDDSADAMGGPVASAGTNGGASGGMSATPSVAAPMTAPKTPDRRLQLARLAIMRKK